LYIPIPYIAVVPLPTSLLILSDICSCFEDIIIIIFEKSIPSKNISRTLPNIYIAIAEYKTISISLKNNKFKNIIIVSKSTINEPVLVVGLKDFTIWANKSVPPVEAPALNVIAAPNPDKIPPYIHAKSLSVVGVAIPSNKFKKYDNDIVPKIAPIKYFFPFL